MHPAPGLLPGDRCTHFPSPRLVFAPACSRVRRAQLLGPPLFPSGADVSGAIQDVVALLRVPRSALGIACSPRGAVAGRVALRDGPGGAWVDCGALGMAGHAIPGELAAVERLSFRWGQVVL
jgi:hypothetical protein